MAASTSKRKRKFGGKEYKTPPLLPCTPKELDMLLEKWIVVVVVLCVYPGEDEEERPALLAVVIIILQKSSRFKNLFDQLGLIVNE